MTIQEVCAGGRLETLLTYSRDAAKPTRLRVEQDAYVATWLTKSLDPHKSYRIRVASGRTELGFADVDVVKTAAQAAKVDRRLYVPVVKGKPFEIRFGIYKASNQVPVANGQTVSTDEDFTLPIQLTGSDAENAQLTYVLLGQPNHGTLSGTAPRFFYAPDANYNGEDQFSFRVSDGTDSSAAASVQIYVTPVNDVPTADAQTVTTPEHTPLQLELTGTDIEDAELGFQVLDPPLHGTLSGDEGAFIVYTPDANYVGTDSFGFVSSDSDLAVSSLATVSITVTSVNGAPTANAQALEVLAGVPLPITLAGSDPDGDALTFAIVRQPNFGSLSGSGEHLFYTSAPNYRGLDELEFVALDGELTSAPAKVTISVSRPNGPPSIVSTPEETGSEADGYQYDVSATDPDDDPLVYAVDQAPETLAIDAETGFLSGVLGPELVQPVRELNEQCYVIPEGAANGGGTGPVEHLGNADLTLGHLRLEQVVGGWTLSAEAINRGLTDIASTSTVRFIAGRSLDGAPLGDASVPPLQSGQSHWVSISLAAAPIDDVISAAITSNAPLQECLDDNNVSRAALVRVRASDPSGLSGAQAFLVNHEDSNDPPQITSQPVVQLEQGLPYNYQVTVHDPDVGDAHEFELITAPTGLFIDPPSGKLGYDSRELAPGTHDVVLQVTDLRGAVATQSFQLTVTANAAPTITSTPDLSAKVGQAYTYQITATDRDGDGLAYRLDGAPRTMTLDPASGLLRFTPEAIHLGNQAVAVIADDLRGGIARQSFTLVVSELPQNHPPVALDDTYEVSVTGTFSVAAPGILGNDTDPDGDVLSASLVTGPSNGTIILEPNGSFAYTPNAPSSGSAAFAARIEWAWMTGTPQVSDTRIVMSPTVADLDLDGVPEVLFTTFSNQMFVLSGRDGRELFRKSNIWGVSSSVVVGDLEGDGRPDIVAVGASSRLLAFEGDGTPKWDIALPFNIAEGNVALADLDGDGKAEIVTGESAANSGVAAFNYDGTVRWRSPDKGCGNNDYRSNCIPTIADIDLDGSPEIIGGHTVYASDGSVKWSADTIGDGFTAVGNFDGDAFPEIVLVRTGRVFLLEHDGRVKWGPVAIPGGGSGGPPTVADFDHDGAPEIGVAGQARYVVFETNGTVKWQAVIQDVSAHTSSTVFDFENDGAPEVVYRDESKLYVFRGSNGAVLFSTTIGSTTTVETPVVADLDGDGQAEIAVGSDATRALPEGGQRQHGLYVFGSANGKWAPARKIWNQFDYHVTNVLDDGTIPAHEQPNWLVPHLNTHRVNSTPPEAAQEPLDSFTYRTHDGALDSNTATVSVRVKPPNRAPQIIGTPPLISSAGDRYTYAVQVTDPDAGDVFTYALTENPAGMTINALGVVDWTPSQSQVAAHRVTVRVRDRAGFSAFQVYTLTVRPPNQLPQITSSPVITAEVGVEYAYAVQASDPDGDPLTYKLADGPLGMSIDAVTGVIRWTPPAGTPNEGVEVAVDDGRGAPVTQAFTITFANHPPAITSTPIESMLLGNTYTYAVQASDADGELLSFRLTSAPPGMTIGDTTGLVQWTPATAQLGSHAVSVEVSDGRGGRASQDFTLTVRSSAQNRGPEITSTPAFQGKVGRAYSYLPTALDPDGDPLTWSLSAAPSGMTVNPTSGAISWVPTNEGTYLPRLRVSDGLAATEQAWSIAVVSADVVLMSELLISPSTVLPGQSITVGVAVSGEAGPVTVRATLDGTLFPLEPNQWLILTAPSTIGQHCIVVDVSDDYETKHLESCFRVIDGSDTQPPRVHIDAPRAEPSAELLIVTAPEQVIASVEDENLARWTLTLREQGAPENEAIELASGDSSIYNVEVGRLDPTLLLNGLYSLVLTGEDAGGNLAEDSVLVSIEGAMKLGDFSISFEDLTVPVAGLPITVTRTYDTRQRHRNLDFGYGWNVDFTSVRLQESRRPGFAWTLTAYPSGPLGMIPNWCVESALGNVVSVSFPDGEVEKFRAVVSPECNQGEPWADVLELRFEPLEGTHGKLEALDGGHGILLNDMVSSLDDLDQPLDPSVYRYTSPEGEEFTIDQSFGLRQITEHEVGSTVAFSREGVIHSNGLSITFVRDEEGRIARVIAPDASEVHYEYSPNGDLSAVLDANENRAAFTYLSNPNFPPHYLENIFDPLGVRVSRNEYGEDGRLVAVVDANGKRIEYDRDIDGRVERIKNRNGFVTTYLYNDRGDVLVETNPLGHSINRSYDADGNTLTETDALGRTERFTYDSLGNVLTETSASGSVTRHSFGAFNQLSTITNAANVVVLRMTYDNTFAGGEPIYPGGLSTLTDANGKVIRFFYDAATGAMDSMVAPTGAQIQIRADARGYKVADIDALGQRTDYVNDAMGRALEKRQTFTNARGESETLLTRYTRDANGNVLSTEEPDGSITTMAYDANDRVIEDCDALGRCTTIEYDSLGEVSLVTDPDGSAVSTTYDAEGNMLSETNRLGLTTRYVYDAAGQPVETILPDATPGDEDNPRERSVYDAARQLVEVIDEAGNTTTYEYDLEGRESKISLPAVDGQRAEIITEYDAVGNRTRVIDPNGHATRFEYDAKGALLRTIDPTIAGEPEAITTVDYDALGRRIAETDASGRTVRFVYDARDQLVSVVLPNPVTGANPALVNGVSPDAGTLTTRFAYDELGNRVQQVDAEDRITRWEFDGMGREVARIIPENQRETKRYNSAGELIAHTDFNGNTTTFEYDVAGRLTRVVYADGAVHRYAYNAEGERTRITDERGQSVFAFDAIGRMVQSTDPRGATIEYGYDAVGNLTQRKSPHQTLAYAYDARSRLELVTRTSGSEPPLTAQLGYDAKGNRTSLVGADGTRTEYTHDARGRLRSLSKHTVDNALLASARYRFDAAGRRTRVEEVDAAGLTRNVDYAYDGANRLAREAIDHVDALYDRSSAWTYDRVGNRLTQSVLANGTTEVTSYTYDRNDRLSTEERGASTTTYAYDANGNTLRKAGPGLLVDYRYNDANRLVETQAEAGISRYSYDTEGLLVERVHTPTNGAPVRAFYLQDNTFAYAQVLEELVQDGDEEARLSITRTFVDELLAEARYAGDGIPSHGFFQLDGTGSTRWLTDIDGGLTDSIDYDAFGSALSRLGSTELTHLYRGESFDSNTGLYYLRARWMDPKTGRFTQQDVHPGSFQDPLSLNKYLYAHADPANHSDPSGLLTLFEQNITTQLMQQMAKEEVKTAVKKKVVQTLISKILGTSATVVNAVPESGTLVQLGAAMLLAQHCKAAATSKKAKNKPTCYLVGVPTLLNGGDSRSTNAHIGAALLGLGNTYADGHIKLPMILVRSERSAVYPRRGKKGCLGKGTKKDCDEYPYGSTLQGGNANWKLDRVSLMYTPSWDNRSQGARLGNFYKKTNLDRQGTMQGIFLNLWVPTIEPSWIDRSGKWQEL